MGYHVSHLIQGKSVSSDSSLAIINPATGQSIGRVAVADSTVAHQAIDAAQLAFQTWSATPPQKRAQILFKFKTLLEQHIDELSQLISQEHGKTRDDAKGDVLRGIECVEFTCATPYLLRGSFSENVSNNMDCYTTRQPLGVCVGVAPFNFPVMVPIWMFIPAIACGNTFVLKPSEQDPSAPRRLVELLEQAGCPPGVVNIVNGDKNTATALTEHPQVKAVTAVASSAVSQQLYQAATSRGKRAAMFGGAKNHAVVMPDAEINATADAITGAAYGSAGERCMAISVVLAVGEHTGDRLVEALHQRIATLNIGPGDQPDTDMGPLISAQHLDKVQSYIEQGCHEGAQCVYDGRGFKHSEYPEGYYLGPCLFDHVQPNMQIYQQEIFGPVLSIVRVDNLEQAIELVSQHQYGNGAAIFTQHGETARQFSHQVQIGMVGINVAIPVPIAYHSFGGWKSSMFGDLAMHGDQSVQFYTKLKTVTTRWPKGSSSAAQYTMPTH